MILETHRCFVKPCIDQCEIKKGGYMAGAGTGGENQVKRVVQSIEGDDVEIFEESVNPLGPTKEEIEGLKQWEEDLFRPPKEKE